MIKRFKSLTYGFLVLLILIVSMILFCVNSTPGLYLVLKGIEYHLPGHLHIKGLEGRLKDKLSAKKLTYEDDNINITLLNVSLDWQLSSLLHGHLLAHSLQADKLIINKKHSTPPPTPPHLPFAISLQNLSLSELQFTKAGKTRRIHAIKTSQLFINHKAWAINRASIQLNKTTLNSTLYGQTIAPFSETLKIRWQPTDQHKGVSGRLQIDGNAALFKWKARLLKPFQVKGQGTLTNLKDISSSLHWANVKLRQSKHFSFIFPKGEAQLKGQWDKLNMQLSSLVQTPIDGQLKLTANYDANLLNIKAKLFNESGALNAEINHNPNNTERPWQGQIKTDSFDLSPMIALEQFKLKSDFWAKDKQAFQLKGDLKARYNEQALSATLTLDPKDAFVQIKQADNQATLKGKPPFAWQLSANIPSLEYLQPQFKGFKTSMSLNASTQDAHHGEAQIKISAGVYNINNKETNLAFKGGEGSAKLSPHGLSAEGHLSIDAHKTLNAQLSLAKFALDEWDSAKQSIQADLNLFVNNLEFIQNLSPLITHTQGELSAGLHVKGVLAEPIITGDMALKNARAQLPKLGLTLEPIYLQMKSQDQHWDLTGQVTSATHPIQIKGEGRLMPFDANISLQGLNVPIINTTQYQFEASPDLLFAVSEQKLSLSGTIGIPSARIKPHTFSDSVSLSEDVVLIKQHKESQAIPLYLDIELQTGKDVLLDTKGLKGYLDGAVKLQYSPKNTLNLTGELNIRDGEYNAFSQKLIVDQGALIYSGSSIDNPSIQLRAIRRFNNAADNFSGSNHLFDFNADNIQNIDFADKTTVGIAVSGRLSAAKIKLFSIPASLSQADILSLLLLGRPSSQASQAGGKLLLAAISSMNLGSGTKGVQLLQQLKESIGIDIDVQNNAGFNQQNKQTSDNTAFVLSKSLSKRLILSYNLGLLGTDNNVLTLRYLLNKFFSIQVNASDTASGVDLLYTHSKD